MRWVDMSGLTDRASELLQVLDLEEFFVIASGMCREMFGSDVISCVLEDQHGALHVQWTRADTWDALNDETLLRRHMPVFESVTDAAPVRIWDSGEFLGISRLHFQHEPFGYFILHRTDRQGRIDEKTFRQFAALFAIGFVRTELYQEACNENMLSASKLTAINHMGELLTSMDLETLLAKIMELVLNLCDAQIGAIVLYEDNGRLETRVEWGLDAAVLCSIRTIDGQCFLETLIAQDSGPRLILEYQQLEHVVHMQETEHLESMIVLPLRTRERKLGAVCALNLGERGREDQHLVEVMHTVCGLAATAVENAILSKASLEKERIQEQLHIARKIQQSLLPSASPVIPGYSIAAWNNTCDETGGDYFDFLGEELGKDKLGVVIGDVSGHGIGAALVMAEVRALLRAFSIQGGDLQGIMASMNRIISQDTDYDQFITLFFAMIEPSSGKLIYASAGHDEPMLYRAGKHAVDLLPSTGLPLGVLDESDFDLGTPCVLEHGDVLVLMTDGVWEATNAREEAVGRTRVERWLMDSHMLSAEGIIEKFRNGMRGFCHGSSQMDDVTMMVVKREPAC